MASCLHASDLMPLRVQQKAGPSGPTIQNPELQPIMHMNPDKVPMDEVRGIRQALLTCFRQECGIHAAHLILTALFPLLLQEMSIDCEIVCISRAGQDPVAKKQNQDNAFVYDFYMQHDQRLFAALDGHGPNGALLLLTVGLSRPPSA